MSPSTGEGLKSPSKRKFLEAAVAGVLAASGIMPEEASAESKKEKEKRIEKIKDENTIIELEKELLLKLNNEKDIEEINNVEITDAEKIVHNKSNKHLHDLMTAVAAIFTAAVASSYVSDRLTQHLKNQESKDADFSKTALTALVGGVGAGIVLYNQPKAEHVGAAENRLIIEWLTPIKQTGGIISKESITERIKILTELQKTNSASVFGKK